MTDELQRKYACETGPCKKYSSNYTWTLHHWSLFHDSPVKRGATSINFDLNGTPGYTCKFAISPSESDWYFVIEMSDTRGIEVMIATVWLASWKLTNNPLIYDKPIPKRHEYQTKGRLNRDHLSYILKDDTDDTLKIKITITIFKEADVIKSLNSTAVAPFMFNAANSAPPNISAEFKTMLEQKTFCDVTFVVGGKTFHAHKVVIAAQSTLLKSMFLYPSQKQTDNGFEIFDISAEAFQEFLNYFYSGEISEWDNVIEEMILLADFYRVAHLKIMCENFMWKSVSKNSAVKYLMLADKHNCETLLKKALRIIRNNGEVLEKALLEEDIATVTCLKKILAKHQPKVQVKEERKSVERDY